MDEIEKIADSDTFGIYETIRIRSLNRRERREEYLRACERINEGRKKGNRGMIGFLVCRNAMAQIYGQHPNSNDFLLAFNAIAITAITGGIVYLICHEGIIKPVIEYSLK